MKNIMKIGTCLFAVYAAMILGIVGTTNQADAADRWGIEIREAFEPGVGDPIGTVIQVQGDVLIQHKYSNVGYLAADDLPLFMGDTLMSKDRSRARLTFEDESMVTIASNSRITLTRSIYDPDKKHRSGFFQVAFGKARFVVRKLSGYKNSEYKIKTQTSVLGVRGSDFIVEVGNSESAGSGSGTKITTAADTRLEVRSLDQPESPVFLDSYQQVLVPVDAPPEEIISLTPDEVDAMIEDFDLDAQIADVASQIQEEVRSEERRSPEGTTSETSASEGSEGSPPEQGSLARKDGEVQEGGGAETSSAADSGTGSGSASATESGVMVSENELVQPQDLSPIDAGDGLVVPEISTEIGDIGQTFERNREEIIQDVHEEEMEVIRPFLFPDPPTD